MKKMYDKKIKDLQDANKKSIEQLLQEFKINLDKVQKEYVDSQNQAIKRKVKYEKKLSILDVEHETEFEENKYKHDQAEKQMRIKQNQLTQIQQVEDRAKEHARKEKEQEEREMEDAKKNQKETKNRLE